jgi:hypothetical protein
MPNDDTAALRAAFAYVYADLCRHGQLPKYDERVLEALYAEFVRDMRRGFTSLFAIADWWLQ